MQHVGAELVSVQDVVSDGRNQQNKTGSTTKQNQLNGDRGWIISTDRERWNSFMLPLGPKRSPTAGKTSKKS